MKSVYIPSYEQIESVCSKIYTDSYSQQYVAFKVVEYFHKLGNNEELIITLLKKEIHK